MSHRDVPERRVRVLVTGAGGPAAVSVMKSLRHDPTVELIAADMDPWAGGLYLVPADARTLIPAGLDPGFAGTTLARCVAMGVNIVIPTVDAELRPLNEARAEYAQAGIDLLLAPGPALDVTLDKLALARRCAGKVRVPRTECFDEAIDPASWIYPVIVKPRTGSGSRDISVVPSSQALTAMDASADFIVQEYLPGDEYSIDVLADASGHVVASVPRERTRVDSGVSVAGRIQAGLDIRDIGQAGHPALLEVNPRVPGALPLTVASGVDMPRMALDSLRGRPLPEHADFREVAMVRYLEERFIELSEVQKLAA